MEEKRTAERVILVRVTHPDLFSDTSSTRRKMQARIHKIASRFHVEGLERAWWLNASDVMGYYMLEKEAERFIVRLLKMKGIAISRRRMNANTTVTKG